jgi:hypothetical protein
MAVDGTYMAMLNETLGNNGQEWDGFGSPPEEQQDTPFCTTPNTQRSKKVRNKNFCESEDVVFVRAWLETSIDAITGTNQKKCAFWTRVHNFYHSEKEITVHATSNSLSHRWGTIQDSVNQVMLSSYVLQKPINIIATGSDVIRLCYCRDLCHTFWCCLRSSKDIKIYLLLQLGVMVMFST